MIVVLLFILSLILYLRRNVTWSLVIFFFFCYRFFRLIPYTSAIIDGPDWAVLYVVAVAFLNRKNFSVLKGDTRLKYYVSVFIGLLVLLVFLSLTYYGLDFVSILKAARQSFVLCGVFILKQIKTVEIRKLVRILCYITILHAFLYVIQVVTGIPVMGVQAEYDAATGAYRYLNCPPLNDFVLFICVFCPNFFKEKIKVFYPIVLLGSLICTLGRVHIVFTILILLYGLYLQGKIRSIIKLSVVFVFILFLSEGMLTARFGGESETNSDIEEIFTGGVQEAAKTGIVPFRCTLTYRLAIVYQRLDRMKEGIIEPLFGFGLEFSEDNISKNYNFSLSPDIFSPDIAYSNIISKYGLLGFVLFCLIWGRVARLCYWKRKEDPLLLCAYLNVWNTFAISITGSEFSFLSWLMFPILMALYAVNLKRK